MGRIVLPSSSWTGLLVIVYKGLICKSMDTATGCGAAKTIGSGRILLGKTYLVLALPSGRRMLPLPQVPRLDPQVSTGEASGTLLGVRPIYRSGPVFGERKKPSSW